VRENPFDVFVSRTGADLESLSAGATVATGSLRRRAQLLRYRNDLIIRDIRGNVDTRLKRLHDGFADGLVLAAAALKRLGRVDSIAQYLHPDMCIPAAGQGALGIEIREDNRPLKELLAMLHDQESGLTVRAERCFLHALGAGCHTPAGAYAELSGGEMLLRGFVASPDGKEMVRMKMLGRRDEGEILGELLARRVLKGGGSNLLAEERGKQ
jgi:hydroxymethylbilane synthase